MANLFQAANAPTEVPSEIVLGDFVQWKSTEYSTDYANSAHTLTFIARASTGENVEFTITATNTGDDYLFTANSTTTSGYTAAHYHYQIEVLETSSSNRIVLDQGEIDVLVDLDVNSVDPRTHAETMLQKIEALIEARASNDVASYSLAGRSLTKKTDEELRDMRDYYRREVKVHKRKLDMKHGRKTSSSALMRFI